MFGSEHSCKSLTIRAVISFCLVFSGSSVFGQSEKSVLVKSECIDFIDSPASFPGGSEQFQKWFIKEVLKRIQEKGIVKGRVQFIINELGKVCEVKIVEINNSEFKIDIIQILNKSPSWNPQTTIYGEDDFHYSKQWVELPFEIQIL